MYICVHYVIIYLEHKICVISENLRNTFSAKFSKRYIYENFDSSFSAIFCSLKVSTLIFKVANSIFMC